MISSDDAFMKEAFKEAVRAFEADEVPVGAVIVHKDIVIARAHNQVEMLKDPTAHAEMIAVTQACSTLSSKWLQDCTVYVTVEPCSMCAGALVLARISRLCIGAMDPKAGACGSVVNIACNNELNHRIDVVSGIQADVCGGIMTDFFQKKRTTGGRAARG